MLDPPIRMPDRFDSPQEWLVDVATRMASLHENPQPGLVAWNLAAEQIYKELKAAVAAEEKRRKDLVQR